MRRSRWAGLLLLGYVVAHHHGRTAGSTWQERRTALPGDGLVPHPRVVTDHAVTIRAKPAQVWPWLTQIGGHRGGYYTPRWVDEVMFPQAMPSPHRLDPDRVRDLAVGDTVADVLGNASYQVVQADPPSTLVLRSGSHLAPPWTARLGASADWSWCFHLAPRPGGRTRLHVRARGRTAQWWLTALYAGVVVPADGVMSRGMLRGIRRRAELRPQPASP